jgi:tetratricopeptide (TPR) repeat protein
MAITKKKRRKKRDPKKYELPQTDEEKSKVQFRDDFQKTIGQRIEDLGSKLEGKGRLIMYCLGGLAVVLIIASIFYISNQRTVNVAKAALGNAIETSQARITDAPLPAGATEKTFKTKKERAEASIKEFQEVANKYGGDFALKASYFAAVSRLDIDRGAGIKELQELSGKSGDTGAMAKFALAEAFSAEGKADDAAKLYQELLAIENPVISKTTINSALARIYEKQGKNTEAAAIYFEIAKAANEAKDSSGKSIPLTITESEAKAKLEELDPEKAKEIKEPEVPAPGLPPGALN